MTRGARAVAAFALAALVSGCGYTIGLGGNLPSHIKTVAVPIFVNGTQQPAVENFITAAVVNAFVTSGRLKVVPVSQADSILEGITRETILAIAPTVPIAVEVREMTPYDLYTADEVLLTSTVIGVQPILELDGRTIGSGKRGQVAARLQSLYDEVLLREGTPFA